ncbi:MAG: hypothetical protein GX224_01450 [Thermoplasmatales archaeon]|nr:hypothetical protein [Thermoplasmatales archaeon]
MAERLKIDFKAFVPMFFGFFAVVWLARATTGLIAGDFRPWGQDETVLFTAYLAAFVVLALPAAYFTSKIEEKSKILALLVVATPFFVAGDLTVRVLLGETATEAPAALALSLLAGVFTYLVFSYGGFFPMPEKPEGNP